MVKNCIVKGPLSMVHGGTVPDLIGLALNCTRDPERGK